MAALPVLRKLEAPVIPAITWISSGSGAPTAANCIVNDAEQSNPSTRAPLILILSAPSYVTGMAEFGLNSSRALNALLIKPYLTAASIVG